MDTKELSKEQISAFVDGELSDAQVEIVMAALRTEQGQAAWNDYHLIGDAARSDETAIAMSPDFMSRLSARLDAEPTVIAPATAPTVSDRKQADRMVANGAAASGGAMRRFGIPALALSLAAAIGFMLQPHTQQQSAQVAATAAAPATLARDTARDADIARDPKLDRALGSHQEFAEQSTEEYGRSAAYNIGADKAADKAAAAKSAAPAGQDAAR